MSNVAGATAPSVNSSAFGGLGSRTALARKLTYGMMGVAGVLLLGAGGGFYLINGQIQSAQAVQADREAKVGSAKQVASRYDSAIADNNAARDQLKYLEKPAPLKNYIPTMLPQVQKLAETYGCTVSSITPGSLTAAGASTSSSSSSASTASSGGTGAESKAAPAYQTMTLSMSLTGTYNQLMSFVYNLTRFPKIITVKSISLHPSGNAGTGANQVISADLNLSAYVFADQASDALQSGSSSAGASHLGSVSAARAAQQDVVTQTLQTPASAAMGVQRTSEEHLNSAGLQAEPSGSTLPTNPALRK